MSSRTRRAFARSLSCLMAVIAVFQFRPARGAPTDIFNLPAPAIGAEAPKARDLRSGDLSVASQTGAAQYRFAVQVPPGRGVTPDIGLSYSSQSPLYGDIAAGWQLTGLPIITEYTQNGRLLTHSALKEIVQPSNADADDRFTSTLAGGRPLVQVTEFASVQDVRATYRAQHADNGFLRYHRMVATAPYRWRVLAPDGTTMYFGDTSNMGDCQHVSWGYAPLTRRVDQWGNEIAFTYKKGVDNECIIDKVTWGQNAVANLEPFAEIQFQWLPGPQCSGVHVGSKLDWRSGVPMVSGANELQAIKVFAYPPGGSPSSAVHTRHITLEYDPTAKACEAQHSAIRFLTSIQESAWGTDAPRVDLPPVTFEYGLVGMPAAVALTSHTNFGSQIPWAISSNATSANLAWGKRRLPGNETWPTVEEMFLDIDGDGRPDRLASTIETVNGVTSCGVTWRQNKSGPNGVVFGSQRTIKWGEAGNFRMPMLRWQGTVSGLAGSTQYDPTNPHYEGCALNGQVTAYHNSHPSGTECHDGSPCPAVGTYCPDGNLCGPNGNDPRTYLAYRWLDMDGDGLVDLVAAVHGSPDVYDIIRGNDIDPLTHLRVDYEPPLFGTVPVPSGFPSCSGDLPDLCKRLGTNCTTRHLTCDVGQPCNYDWSELNVCLEQADDMDCELDIGESTVLMAGGNDGDTPTPPQHQTPRQPYKMCGHRYPWFIFKNRGQGKFDDTPTIKYQPIPLESDSGDSALYGPTLATPKHGVLDLDGDQLLDGIAQGRDADASENEAAHWWTVWPNDGTGQLGPRRYMWFGRRWGEHHISANYNPTYVTSGSAMGLFDINGDGLPDHWLANPAPSTTANIAYNTGTGFHVVGGSNWVQRGTLDTIAVKPGTDSDSFGPVVTDAPNQVQTGSRYSPLRVLDLDADGRVDALVTSPTKIEQVSWNHGGQFSPLLSWNSQLGVRGGAPNIMHVDDTTIAAYAWFVLGDQIDLDGDGIAESLYFSGQMQRDARWPDTPPRLLRSIDNHRGLTTTITYTSMHDDSTVVQELDDPVDGFWWDGRPKATPVAQWVVSSYSTHDAFSDTNNATTMKYEHPRHGADDEGRYSFRGFAKVTATSQSGSQTEEHFGYAVDWSGRLEKTLVRPAEEPTKVHSIAKTTWEPRTLFGGTVTSYHAVAHENFVCANGQDEATCTTSGPGYTRTTSTLAPITPLGGGPALLWHEAETLLQAGTADADGDRKTISSVALYADGTTYRLRDLETTRQQRVGGTFTTFAKSASTWNTSYKEKLTDEVWVDANDSHRAITRYVYDPNTGNVLQRFKPEQNAASGPSATYQYDTRGLFVAVETNELGHVRDFEYEYGTGTKLSTSGPNPAYCQGTCPPGMVCMPKERHAIVVDGLGREIEQWDTTGGPCTFPYLQRTATTYFEGAPSSPAWVRHRRHIDANEGTWTDEKTEVDGRGRPIKKTVFVQGTAPFDQITTYTYSSYGPLVSVEVPDPSANTSARVAYTYTYDSLNRPLTIRRPDAANAEDKSGIDIVYDGLTKITKEESGSAGGNEAVTKTVTDRFGRLIEVHEQLTDNPDTWAITSYSYGPDDLVTSVVDPENVTTSLVHDFAGRRTEITRHGRTWKYGYDKNGNMISEQVPGSPNPPVTDINYTTTIDYDDLDRPISKVVGQRELSAADQALFGGNTETLLWDIGGNMIGYLRLWQSFAPNEPTPLLKVDAFVDSLGLQQSTIQTFNIAGYSNLQRKFFNNHNVMGVVKQTWYYDEFTYSDCSSADCTNAIFSYDARGLPSQIQFSDSAGPAKVIGNQTRNVAGLVTKRRTTPPAGGPMSYVESNWAYDKLGRVTSQVVQKSPSPSEIVRQDLSYLGNDDPSSLEHWLGTSSKKLNFTFDKRHQLTGVTSTTPGYFQATYEFGTAGRFTRAAEAQTITPTPNGSEVAPRDVTYVYGGADPEQVTALVNVGTGSNYATFTYDLAGNQTKRCLGTVANPSCTGTFLEYTYDGQDQLRRVTKKQNGVTEGSEEYWYDSNGSRIATVKRDNLGDKTEFVTFTGDTEAHFDGSGEVEYVYSHLSLGTPVARIKRTGNTTTETEYQFHGLANSTIAAVAFDGLINVSFVYAPFGSIVEATNDGGSVSGTLAHSRRFNDKRVDEVSGLAYYGARSYDRIMIGWTQGDPLYRFRPEAAGSEPRRARLYAFSESNPLRYIDPDGCETVPTLRSVCGANCGPTPSGTPQVSDRDIAFVKTVERAKSFIAEVPTSALGFFLKLDDCRGECGNGILEGRLERHSMQSGSSGNEPAANNGEFDANGVLDNGPGIGPGAEMAAPRGGGKRRGERNYERRNPNPNKYRPRQDRDGNWYRIDPQSGKKIRVPPPPPAGGGGGGGGAAGAATQTAPADTDGDGKVTDDEESTWMRTQQ